MALSESFYTILTNTGDVICLAIYWLGSSTTRPNNTGLIDCSRRKGRRRKRVDVDRWRTRRSRERRRMKRRW